MGNRSEQGVEGPGEDVEVDEEGREIVHLGRSFPFFRRERTLIVPTSDEAIIFSSLVMLAINDEIPLVPLSLHTTPAKPRIPTNAVFHLFAPQQGYIVSGEDFSLEKRQEKKELQAEAQALGSGFSELGANLDDNLLKDEGWDQDKRFAVAKNLVLQLNSPFGTTYEAHSNFPESDHAGVIYFSRNFHPSDTPALADTGTLANGGWDLQRGLPLVAPTQPDRLFQIEGRFTWIAPRRFTRSS